MLVVRVLDGERHITYQPQALLQRARVLRHVVEQRNAVNQLQHDERLPGFDAGIEQARNVGVIEPRQHHPLAGETARQLVVREISAQQLHRDAGLVQAVAALRPPHFAHAAFAKAALQRPGAEFLADGIAFGGLGQRFFQYGIERRLSQGHGLVNVCCCHQQRHQLLGDERLATPEISDVGDAISLGQVDDFVEQVGDTLPELRRQVGELHRLGHGRLCGRGTVGRRVRERCWPQSRCRASATAGRAP